MDLSKLSHGAKLVLAGTVVFLIVSFFNWQEVEFGDIASAGRSMWSGWGTLAGLLAIALLVWEGIRLANVNVSLPVTPAMTSAFLAILLLIATILKFLVDNEFRTFWAWLGLLLAIAIAAGAVMNMQAAGQSFSDMRDTLTAGAAAATAAAKSATDSSKDAAAPVAPQAEAAEAAPAVVEDVAETATDAAGEPGAEAADEGAGSADDRPAV
jgi:hypothetical protein